MAAPAKYPRQALATIRLLARVRPRLLFVQSPPSFAPLLAALYARLSGATVIVDAHSDAFQAIHWTRPRWLYRWLARTVACTIVTNDHFARSIGAGGGTALVLRDIPTSFAGGVDHRLGEGFHVAVVSTFAPDEPLEEVLAAARRVQDVTFHLTGDPSRADRSVLAGRPPNVRLTGFLPDGDYYALLRGCDAVMCLTTRDNTMQRGACEALTLGRPIITSGWPLLRDYFWDGTVHVDNTAGGIAAGVAEMRASYEAKVEGIARLQQAQRQEWDRAVEALERVMGGGKAGRSR
jgi:glycosyltransferase involved in cell wall biosynthesis